MSQELFGRRIRVSRPRTLARILQLGYGGLVRGDYRKLSWAFLLFVISGI